MNRCSANMIFHFICVLVTIILSTKCVYQYFLNENISLVEYQSFQEHGQSGYPSLSFCVVNPFLEEELRKYGVGINTSSYINFLKGSLWDQRMANIDYDNVTISLNDFLDYQSTHPSWIAFSNGSASILPLSNHVSLRGDTLKCFSIDVPFIKNELLLGFGMSIRSSIFATRSRPSRVQLSKLEGFFVSFHFPKQMLIASNSWKYKWKPRSNMDKYVMNFNVKAITVVNKRKQSGSSCIDDMTGYDQYVKDSMIKSKGCKPSYWKTNLDVEVCSQSKVKFFTTDKIFMRLHIDSNDIPPCSFIEHVDYEYIEDEDPELTSGTKFSFFNWRSLKYKNS